MVEGSNIVGFHSNNLASISPFSPKRTFCNNPVCSVESKNSKKAYFNRMDNLWTPFAIGVVHFWYFHIILKELLFFFNFCYSISEIPKYNYGNINGRVKTGRLEVRNATELVDVSILLNRKRQI